MTLPDSTSKAIAAHLAEHSERCRTGLRLPRPEQPKKQPSKAKK